MQKAGQKMNCEICELHTLSHYKYVVILSKLDGKWLLSRHKNRDTWETQGGHIETGETPEKAAKRELFEESGALEFSMKALCDYWASDDTSKSNGVVFLAEIRRLGKLPDYEMKEVKLFHRLPDNLTYPDITPKLFRYLQEQG